MKSVLLHLLLSFSLVHLGSCGLSNKNDLPSELKVLVHNLIEAHVSLLESRINELQLKVDQLESRLMTSTTSPPASASSTLSATVSPVTDSQSSTTSTLPLGKTDESCGANGLSFTEIGCDSALASGVQEIYNASIFGKTVSDKLGFCQIEDGKNWLVILRREDDYSLDFSRTWREYEIGFGDPVGSYWLGNLVLSLLTESSSYELKVEVKIFDDVNKSFKTLVATYANFKMASVCDNYRLTVSGYSGDAGDLLSGASGQPFSTIDKVTTVEPACLAPPKTGWWRSEHCDDGLIESFAGGNLNGIALQSIFDTQSFVFGSESVEMKIRKI